MNEAEKWRLVADVLAVRLVVLQRKDKETILKEALKYVGEREKWEKRKKQRLGK